MSKARDEYTDLMADACITVARDMTTFYFQEIEEPPIGQRVGEKFAFMAWTIAQGVWSNISQVALRRDLQSELKDKIVFRLATQRGGSVPDQGAFCVNLNDDFKEYLAKYREVVLSLPEADLSTSVWFSLLYVGADRARAPEMTARALQLDSVNRTHDLAAAVVIEASRSRSPLQFLLNLLRNTKGG